MPEQADPCASVESACVTIMSFCLDANGPKDQDLDLFTKKSKFL